jgi:hypothetical protein
MSRLLIVIAVAIAVAVTGCGSGSDKPKSSAQSASSSSPAQTTNNYQAQVTTLIHQVIAANTPFDKAKGNAQVVARAQALDERWLAIAAKLDAVKASSPTAKKYQDQLVAVLRKAAGQIKDELSQSHPDGAKINQIFGDAVPSMGPIISSLYSAP